MKNHDWFLIKPRAGTKNKRMDEQNAMLIFDDFNNLFTVDKIAYL